MEPSRPRGLAVLPRFLITLSLAAAVAACSDSPDGSALKGSSTPLASARSAKTPLPRIGALVFSLTFVSTGTNVAVVEGTSSSAMKAGAGHLAQTPMPGELGNVVVVGRVRFYGRPFRGLGLERPGERLVLRLLDGRAFTYQVVPPFQGHGNPWTTDDLGPEVTGQVGSLGTGSWLTLVTDPSEHTPISVLRLEMVP